MKQPLTETQYNDLADAAFADIESLLDAAGLDLDIAGNVLTVELDDGSKIILNRQPPVHEIWLATKSGGYHFTWDGSRWYSQRDNASLDSLLRRCIAEQGGPTLP